MEMERGTLAAGSQQQRHPHWQPARSHWCRRRVAATCAARMAPLQVEHSFATHRGREWQDSVCVIKQRGISNRIDPLARSRSQSRRPLVLRIIRHCARHARINAIKIAAGHVARAKQRATRRKTSRRKREAKNSRANEMYKELGGGCKDGTRVDATTVGGEVLFLSLHTAMMRGDERERCATGRRERRRRGRDGSDGVMDVRERDCGCASAFSEQRVSTRADPSSSAR